MKYKNAIICIVLILTGLEGVYAQKTPTATGGEATGTGGTVSYSVGQVAYITYTGTNESIAQGVQQPYEISATVGINKTSINLDLIVYPNPTSNYLNLKIKDKLELSSLNFQLYNMQGKLIESKRIGSSTTRVEMESLPKSTYFLKVTKNNQTVKIFQIIKN